MHRLPSYKAKMEMGSTSLGTTSASSDSLHGLKFGQKIYFEDAGNVGNSSTSAPPPPPGGVGGGGEGRGSSSKKGRGLVQSGQPPRCQVEGCRVDLTGAKAYYCRHKVCGMHSKSPKVIVAGLEQRFCQQCSRFHQLPEFDQGKRSCRRRLAGHNERRRKPPSGSLLSPRHDRITSTFHEDTSRGGGFLGFSYPRLPEPGVCHTIRADERPSTNQVTATGKYLPSLWPGSFEASSGNLVTQVAQTYMQGSSTAAPFPGQEIATGECFAEVSDSGCALSLLSSEPWGPRGQASGLDFMRNDETHVSQPTHQGTISNSFTVNNAWNFKSHDASSSSHEAPAELGLNQMHETINDHFSTQSEYVHPGGRQYMDLGQSRGYDSSTDQINWSL